MKSRITLVVLYNIRFSMTEESNRDLSVKNAENPRTPVSTLPTIYRVRR